MEEAITYVGLDVHKETISVALAEGGARGEVRYFGKIANDGQALRKLAEKLSGQGRRLRFCYEAGPCGYGVYRTLTGLGHDCAVVAPSLIPRRPGDRVKTDRRDCLGLATLERAGELTAVWVRQGIDAGVLDREGASNRIDVRGLAVLIIGPSFDPQVGIPLFAEMGDEGVYHAAVVHRNLFERHLTTELPVPSAWAVSPLIIWFPIRTP